MNATMSTKWEVRVMAVAGAGRLELCDAPGRTPRRSRWPGSANASEVTLHRP